MPKRIFLVAKKVGEEILQKKKICMSQKWDPGKFEKQQKMLLQNTI